MAEAAPSPEIPTAAELRRHMADMEIKRLHELMAKKATGDKAFQDFAHAFLHEHLSAEELQLVKTKIRVAVEHGEFEAMVMRFPSALCSDHGRAINNTLDGWEKTLPGKAAEFYQKWETEAKDRGYRLRAMIVNFPDGLPGDVGLFLNWAAPAA